ncbi:unnamed protein product [Soboliphyme baturini]|uniref:Ig-like domain-containing protein n=1 Tax=Soboliphyme baturini TaxID=241478 RepID=A0A183J5R6_9BILA|nr:unnamed protein product [Soboliphyme baturini]
MEEDREASLLVPKPTGKQRPLAFISPHSSDRFSVGESSSLEELGTVPYFSRELTDVRAAQRDRATFACKLFGEPEVIIWRKDGQIMEQSNDFRQTYNPDTGLCTLTIAEVYVEDQGVISCQAINRFGDATTSCFFTVVGRCFSGVSRHTKRNFDIYSLAYKSYDTCSFL